MIPNKIQNWSLSIKTNTKLVPRLKNNYKFGTITKQVHDLKTNYKTGIMVDFYKTNYKNGIWYNYKTSA